VDVIFWYLLIINALPEIPWYIWVFAIVSELAEWISWYGRKNS
jgi:hypothetical protein